MKIYNLTQESGEEVQALLDKMENLGPATDAEDGLMTKGDKTKLDNEVADRPLSNLEIQAILNT
jgi:hypothetical protein